MTQQPPQPVRKRYWTIPKILLVILAFCLSMRLDWFFAGITDFPLQYLWAFMRFGMVITSIALVLLVIVGGLRDTLRDSTAWNGLIALAILVVFFVFPGIWLLKAGYLIRIKHADIPAMVAWTRTAQVQPDEILWNDRLPALFQGVCTRATFDESTKTVTLCNGYGLVWGMTIGCGAAEKATPEDVVLSPDAFAWFYDRPYWDGH